MKAINFLGVGVHAVQYTDLEKHIDRWLQSKSGRSHHVACVNAYCISLALADKNLARIYNGADIAGADGMPFVRWIRWINGLPCDRLAAPDILMYLAERSKEKDYSFYLYGGAPDVLTSMERNLKKRYPHIRIVGSYSPPFRALTGEEDDAIVENINSVKPDIILVGLGTPKQDYWINDHIGKIRGSVLIASGATFDFFGGRIKMAPAFIRQSGFEWLYRLLGKDFMRLWKRYSIANLKFLIGFSLQLLRLRKYSNQRWERSEC